MFSKGVNSRYRRALQEVAISSAGGVDRRQGTGAYCTDWTGREGTLGSSCRDLDAKAFRGELQTDLCVWRKMSLGT